MLRMAVKRSRCADARKQHALKEVAGNRAKVQRQGYVICDDKAKMGFPIRHASKGFEELFGYSSGECPGLDGLGVINPPATQSLRSLARDCGMREDDARLGMERMTQAFAEAAGSGKMSQSLLIGQSDGSFFVCEVCWWTRQHPSLKWTYRVAMIRDLSFHISVQELLDAASQDSSYERLCQHALDLGSKSHFEPLSEELHGVAERMWKDELAKGIKPKMLTQRSEGTSSIWSRSTASTVDRKVESRSHHLGALLQDSDWEDCETFSECSDTSSLEQVTDPLAHVNRDSLRSLAPAFIVAAVTESFQVAFRSASFEELSGPSRKLRLGSDVREVMRPQGRAGLFWDQFCASGMQGDFFRVETGGLAFLGASELLLPAGELAFVQTFSGKFGNPIDCLVYLKQIELDDCPFLLAVHSYLSDDESIENRFNKVSDEVDEIIFKLASEFLYYAPMRRQRAC